MRRFALITALALSLAACGGEKYPIPAGEAYDSLVSVGIPSGAGLLAPMSSLAMTVDSTPDDSSVRWRFSKDGADLGAIVARVDPDGEAASVITTDYVEGTASDDPANKSFSNLIQGGQRQLLEEGIRAHFEKRPFNTDLRKSIEFAAIQSNIGNMMNEASASMDEYAKKSDDSRRESEASRATNPYNATKPMTTLPVN